MLEWYIDELSNLIIREVLMLQNNEEVDNNTKVESFIMCMSL